MSGLTKTHQQRLNATPYRPSQRNLCARSNTERGTDLGPCQTPLNHFQESREQRSDVARAFRYSFHPFFCVMVRIIDYFCTLLFPLPFGLSFILLSCLMSSISWDISVTFLLVRVGFPTSHVLPNGFQLDFISYIVFSSI